MYWLEIQGGQEVRMVWLLIKTAVNFIISITLLVNH